MAVLEKAAPLDARLAALRLPDGFAARARREALERLMHGRTTLIVSHRLSLAQSADRVVVVADGRIAEEGPPAELLARPGSHFAQMPQPRIRWRAAGWRSPVWPPRRS
jgi:ABC-type Fe3+/spermidine/putrescine transport system ATPase subunit